MIIYIYIYVADRETGTFISKVDSIRQGLLLIEAYEIVDKLNGTYEPNFYDVVNLHHESLLKN